MHYGLWIFDTVCVYVLNTLSNTDFCKASILYDGFASAVSDIHVKNDTAVEYFGLYVLCK